MPDLRKRMGDTNNKGKLNCPIMQGCILKTPNMLGTPKDNATRNYSIDFRKNALYVTMDNQQRQFDAKRQKALNDYQGEARKA